VIPKFDCVKPEDWDACVRANSGDNYSMAVVTYAARWASTMDNCLADGEPLTVCAERCSVVADEGIGVTAAMYGMAAHLLVQVWRHGEALRQWHNLRYGGPEQGSKANDAGGVINPAIWQGQT
jgi:hypothetical protein